LDGNNEVGYGYVHLVRMVFLYSNDLHHALLLIAVYTGSYLECFLELTFREWWLENQKEEEKEDCYGLWKPWWERARKVDAWI